MDLIGRHADTEVLWDLPILRNRSRELNRDDPIGCGLTLEFVKKVIGPGLNPQARTGSTLKNNRIEEVFLELSKNLSPADGLPYGALQQMRCFKLLEDGELFVKKSIFNDELKTETIESDRIMTPSGVEMEIHKGHKVVDGIEKDANDVPVAYWVRKQFAYQQSVKTAPLAQAAMMGISFNISDFDRLEPDVLRHVKLTTRPGQTRGVPFLHAVMQDIRDLDLLILASLKRTQLAACMAVFIESSEAAEDILPVTAENYGYSLDQDINPGMIFKLFPGESVKFLHPNFPAFDLENFIKTLSRRIGAALGVSYMTVLQDWADANYSAARQQSLIDQPTFSRYRNMLKPLFAWERSEVLEHAVLTGKLGRMGKKDIDAVEFLDPRQPWIDPEKDAKAIEIQLALGLTTLRDEASALNRDWEDLLQQSILEKLTAEKLEVEMREELGLPSEEEKAKAMVEATAGPQPTDEENADAAEKDDAKKDADRAEALEDYRRRRVIDEEYRAPAPRPAAPAHHTFNIAQPEAPVVHVAPLELTLQASEVTVPEAPAPVVILERAEMPQVVVNVPVQPTPDVHIKVDVKPELTIPSRKITAQYDGRGRLASATTVLQPRHRRISNHGDRS
jgi:lambda family phage portal protein